MTKLYLILGGVLTVSSVGAPAIIMRHDVPDAYYRAMGEHYRLTVVDIRVPSAKGTPLPHGNGIGTLVGPDWVLTAGHIASRVMPGHERSRVNKPHTVYVNGQPYLIEKVILHPRYSEKERPWIDVALIKLATPVPGAQLACLYPAKDEVGQVTILAGTGQIGTGLIGPAKDKQDGLLRASTVRVEGTEAEGTVLSWTFRPPEDAKVTAAEGISGPGDSGGPAFLRHKGQLCVAGVSASQDDRGRGEGRYGVRELYPRVSHYRPWILEVMRKVDNSTPSHRPVDTATLLAGAFPYALAVRPVDRK